MTFKSARGRSGGSAAGQRRVAAAGAVRTRGRARWCSSSEAAHDAGRDARARGRRAQLRSNADAVCTSTRRPSTLVTRIAMAWPLWYPVTRPGRTRYAALSTARGAPSRADRRSRASAAQRARPLRPRRPRPSAALRRRSARYPRSPSRRRGGRRGGHRGARHDGARAHPNSDARATPGAAPPSMARAERHAHGAQQGIGHVNDESLRRSTDAGGGVRSRRSGGGGGNGRRGHGCSFVAKMSALSPPRREPASGGRI